MPFLEEEEPQGEISLIASLITHEFQGVSFGRFSRVAGTIRMLKDLLKDKDKSGTFSLANLSEREFANICFAFGYPARQLRELIDLLERFSINEEEKTISVIGN